jgi:quinol monooxygenase YgiN
MTQLFVITHVDVMPNFTDDGAKLLRGHAEFAAGLDGVDRIEILQQVHRPNHSELLVVCESEAAYDRYVSDPGTRAFREELQPMLGSPFDDRMHYLLSGPGA